jgi:hypothetical protein
MNAKRKKAVRRILELRLDLIKRAGYTAGAEGLTDPLDDAFWERALKAYQLMLHDEGLLDDVTPEEEAECGWKS